MTAEPFDPAPLVALAEAEGRAALAETLSRCTLGERESPAYIRFADPAEASWVVAETVHLSRRGGDVLVDVLTDGRVGGVEFLAHV